MRSITRAAAAIVATAIGLAAVRADSYYVDVVHGDDANGGGSPDDAWRTLTHALALVPDPVPPGEHVIHVAPGTYSPASGEVFPLVVGPGRRIVGEGGSANSRIDGDSFGGTLFRVDAHPIGVFALRTTLAGLELRGAATGVHVQGGSAAVLATLEALDIRGMSGAGVDAWSHLYDSNLTMTGVECRENGIGLRALAGTNGTVEAILLEDCVLSGNADEGLLLWASAAFVTVHMLRSRVEHNGKSGLHGSASLFGGGFVHLEDCLVAKNARTGLEVYGNFDGAAVNFRLERSTVADNAKDGVAALLAGGTIAGSIVYGNSGEDVFQDDLAPTISIEFSNIGDGTGSGSNGNIAADPLFLDAASGDYRLRFASPCVDAGDPQAPAGRPDLAGAPRPIDGALDTSRRADMGALELAPLVFTGHPRPGGLLRVELFGPAGAPAIVWAARAGLADPQPTPFGELELERGSAFPLVRLTAEPGPPALFERPIPSDPAFIGLTVSMQALIRSIAAPSGAAWSNAVSFVIAP